MRYFIAFVALVALLPDQAVGQDPPKPGDRVRITAPEYGLNQHVGVLGQPNAATITVDSFEIPRSLVTRLDIHRGRKGNAGKGALTGGLITGGALGILTAVACSEDDFFDCNPASGFATGFVVGAIPGMLLGAVIGAVSKSDRWEQSPISRIRPTVAPTQEGGFSLGMAIGF